MLISEKYKQDFCTGIIDTIPDSWSDIIRHIDDGTYRDRYHVGDTKVLNIKNHLPLCMQIVAFDADDLSDGSGKAAITWIAEDLFDTQHQMNPVRTGASDGFMTGTGSIGGWEHSETRKWLQDVVLLSLPDVVRNSIKLVRKFSCGVDKDGNAEQVVTHDTLWIPSVYEVTGRDFIGLTEENGVYYEQMFCNNASRRKFHPVLSSADWWWLRSANGTDNFYNVNSSGYVNYYGASISDGVALSFCT